MIAGNCELGNILFTIASAVLLGKGILTMTIHQMRYGFMMFGAALVEPRSGELQTL
jgi:hypothetical protein